MSSTTRHDPRISLYGPTYWDACVDIDIAALGQGKGKVDVPVSVSIGGFPYNAAQAVCAHFGALSVRVVTVSSSLDVPRLVAALPPRVALEALRSGEEPDAFPPISVIVNPASGCRILRDPARRDDGVWTWGRVSADASGAALHVLGRVPPAFARDAVHHAHHMGARIAWCGGAAIPVEVERDFDIVCVNTSEANQLLDTSGVSPADAARELAARAAWPEAVRVVTGRGTTPTAAAQRREGHMRCDLSQPSAVPLGSITNLLGVGDAFAASFLAAACFDDRGAERAQLAVSTALAAAQEIAGQLITTPRGGGVGTD